MCVFLMMLATVMETEPRAKATGKFVNVSFNCCHVD